MRSEFGPPPRATIADDALRPIFILACTFRSGSTFVQRLINSTGQAFIWGENVGLTEELSAAVAKLRSWREISAGQRRSLESDGTRAWIANLTPDVDELESARAFLLSLYAEPTQRLGVKRWGFKEVRHDAAAAAFLLEAFPAARVILLVRDPSDVLASMATSAWYEQAGGAEAIATAWTQATASFAALDDPRALLLRLEDVSRPDTLRRLARHLELDSARFDKALLDHPVRGSTSTPSLGDAERKALQDPALRTLSRSLGY